MDVRFFVPLFVFIAGSYFLARLGWVLLKTKRIRRAKGGFTPKKLGTLTLALAGTLGVGNIFGVATALIIGGVGSAFWLFISAVFSAVIKYAEVSLSLSFTEDGRGMIAVLKKSFGRCGRVFSKLYAVAALALGAVMGFALQGGSLTECVSVSFGAPPLFCAFVIIILILWIISKKQAGIKNFTAFVIPMTTIIYITMALWMILQNCERLPHVMSMILEDAFRWDSGIGGVLGFVMSSRVREGFCGGILSNEAGAGTSSLAHSSGDDIGGFGGVFEVLFDTVILCMLTSVSILVCIPDISSYSSGVELVVGAVYSSFGSGGIGVLSLVTLSFSLCTAVCWYFYSTECARELFGKDCSFAISVTMAVFTILGACTDGKYLVIASHYLLLFLSILSLSALIKNSDKVIKLTLSERRVVSFNITKGGFLNLKCRRKHKDGR